MLTTDGCQVNIHLSPGEARGIFSVFDEDDDAEVSVKVSACHQQRPAVISSDRGNQ